MTSLFESVSDFSTGRETIRRRPYGVIEVIDGRFRRINFRPWPKIISLAEVQWLGQRTHQKLHADACRLYFNQPLASRDYLALKYVVSSFGTSYRTILTVQWALDEVARIKGSQAVVCDVTNDRITDRMMLRWGWESHLNDSPRRHYIKRYYGTYPQTIFSEPLEQTIPEQTAASRRD